MNFIKITSTIALTLLIISCSSISKKQVENNSTLTKYTFKLLAVDEERAKNVDSMSQTDAKVLGDIILVDKRDENTKYLLKANAIVDNFMIENAEVSIDEFRHRPLINIQFSKEGAKIFSDFTAKNIGKRVAIVLNFKVYATPVIAQQISSGTVQITGGFSTEKAFEIVNSINLTKGKR